VLNICIENLHIVNLDWSMTGNEFFRRAPCGIEAQCAPLLFCGKGAGLFDFGRALQKPFLLQDGLHIGDEIRHGELGELDGQPEVGSYFLPKQEDQHHVGGQGPKAEEASLQLPKLLFPHILKKEEEGTGLGAKKGQQGGKLPGGAQNETKLDKGRGQGKSMGCPLRFRAAEEEEMHTSPLSHKGHGLPQHPLVLFRIELGLLQGSADPLGQGVQLPLPEMEVFMAKDCPAAVGGKEAVKILEKLPKVRTVQKLFG